jgi:predicted nucleotide-binding protein
MPALPISLGQSVIYRKRRPRDRRESSTLQSEFVGLAPPATPHSPATRPKPSRKVFVVHGRDDATKNEVALFLSSIGLEPIILHTRPHGGRNILTKFQEESQGAGFAVILMTPDDEGALVGETLQKRARQNVVFELGFFIGKLGTSNVAALVKGHIEKPSDFDGIGYIDFDAKGEWKRLLAREMQYTQIPFDASKVFTA